MGYCSIDNCDVVQNKLDKLSENCNQLSEKSQHRVKVLKETAELSERFYGEHKELSDWFMRVDKLLEDIKDNGEDVEQIKVRFYVT